MRIAVDDGRSFVRRTPERYDVIQASLVDTWAATAAGAYTLTENSLYTVEAFNDYLDHLTDDGVLTITRWVADGLRLVSLAQEACARAAGRPRDRLAIVRQDNVATFLLKKTPFTAERNRAAARGRRAPGIRRPVRARRRRCRRPPTVRRRSPAGRRCRRRRRVHRRLRTAHRRAPTASASTTAYRSDIRPTTDDRPFFFHTTKIEDQFDVAFGQKMLFGNGLSALMTLLGDLDGARRAVRARRRSSLAGRGQPRPRGWFAWLVYFGALGAGFMLIEVSVLQRFVLLLGHPVYSLTVTLFSLLLGTGLGSAWSRRFDDASLRRTGAIGILIVAAIAIAVHRGRHAGRELGDPLFARRADAGRRGDARADRRRARDSDADRHAAAQRAGASDAAVGLGDERRPVGPRRHAGDLHRDELGLPDDLADRVRHLPHRPLALLSATQHQHAQ